MVKWITKREAALVKLRQAQTTFSEIGISIGVSPARARQIYLKTINKINKGYPYA